jgi:hypothetical protein
LIGIDPTDVVPDAKYQTGDLNRLAAVRFNDIGDGILARRNLAPQVVFRGV